MPRSVASPTFVLLIVLIAALGGAHASHGGDWHVFKRVSVKSDGTQGNADSLIASISADGRYTAFETASALVSDDTNNLRDVYVHDLWTAVTVRVSVHTNGTQATFGAFSPSISTDGRYVAFAATSSNLIGEDTDGNGSCDVGCDTNGKSDVFVRDRDVDEDGVFDEPGHVATTRVSVTSAGAQANLGGANPCISADGHHVAFVSDSIPGTGDPTPSEPDVYVHDHDTGGTVLVSVHADGTAGNDASGGFPSAGLPVISGNGRYVLFGSAATNLIDDDTNGRDDYFLHDRDVDGDGTFDEAGQISTTRVSVDENGMEIDNPRIRQALAITPSGRFYSWNSTSADVVAGDPNPNGSDVFFVDRQVGSLDLIGIEPGEDPFCCGNDAPRQGISNDGSWLLYKTSRNLGFVEGQIQCTRSVPNAVIRDRLAGTDELLSDTVAPTTCAETVGSTDPAALSGNGEFLLVWTKDPDYLDGDTNGTVADLVMLVRGSPVFPTPTPSETPADTPTPSATPSTLPARLPDDDAAKDATKCEKEIGLRGAKFVEKKLKSLGKCGTALTKCVQTKDDAKRDDCLVKALDTCIKEFGKITKEEGKLESTVGKTCAAVGLDDLRDAAGLGYDTVADVCEKGFATPLDSVADVGTCVVLQRECRAEEAAEQLLPRLQELIRIAGVDQQTRDAFACLTDFGGAGADVDDPKGLGKIVDACVKEIVKSGGTFLGKILKSHEKCLDTAFACVQQKGGEAKCQKKASKTCDKETAKRGSEADKLASKIVSKCDAADFATMAAGDAANLNALAATCVAFDVGSLDGWHAYATCVEHRLTCLAEDMVQHASPRAGEMAAFAGEPLGSGFCPE